MLKSIRDHYLTYVVSWTAVVAAIFGLLNLTVLNSPDMKPLDASMIAMMSLLMGGAFGSLMWATLTEAKPKQAAPARWEKARPFVWWVVVTIALILIPTEPKGFGSLIGCAVAAVFFVAVGYSFRQMRIDRGAWTHMADLRRKLADDLNTTLVAYTAMPHMKSELGEVIYNACSDVLTMMVKNNGNWAPTHQSFANGRIGVAVDLWTSLKEINGDLKIPDGYALMCGLVSILSSAKTPEDLGEGSEFHKNFERIKTRLAEGSPEPTT